MNIFETLKPSLISTALQGTDKDAVFAELVQRLVDAGLITDRETALRVLREREAKMSTGITKGLALPHGRLPEIRDLIMALGVSRSGISYGTLDGEPVHVVVLVFAQEGNPGPHIQALARISRIFSVPGFTGRIRDASSADDVLELIRGQELGAAGGR